MNGCMSESDLQCDRRLPALLAHMEGGFEGDGRGREAEVVLEAFVGGQH